jgi:putative flippase GtrA
MGIMYLLIDVLSTNELFAKIVSNVFVIIINYVFSKLIIFRKKGENKYE